MTLKVLPRDGQGSPICGQGPTKRVWALPQCWGRAHPSSDAHGEGGGGAGGVETTSWCPPPCHGSESREELLRPWDVDLAGCGVGQGGNGEGVSRNWGVPTAPRPTTFIGCVGGNSRVHRVKVDAKVVLKLGACGMRGINRAARGGDGRHKLAPPTPWGHQGPSPYPPSTLVLEGEASWEAPHVSHVLVPRLLHRLLGAGDRGWGMHVGSPPAGPSLACTHRLLHLLPAESQGPPCPWDHSAGLYPTHRMRNILRHTFK